MRVAAILVAVLALAGCATTQAQAPVPVDTFCLTAKKRLWSIDDTAQTIRDAEAWNLLVDRRCGIPGQKKPRSP